MGIYTGLDEAALEAKIVQLRTAVEELEMGATVVRVAGEGRMMEFSRVRSGGLYKLLRSAEEELKIVRGEDPNSAIGVTFP